MASRNQYFSVKIYLIIILHKDHYILAPRVSTSLQLFCERKYGKVVVSSKFFSATSAAPYFSVLFFTRTVYLIVAGPIPKLFEIMRQNIIITCFNQYILEESLRCLSSAYRPLMFVKYALFISYYICDCLKFSTITI